MISFTGILISRFYQEPRRYCVARYPDLVFVLCFHCLPGHRLPQATTNCDELSREALMVFCGDSGASQNLPPISASLLGCEEFLSVYQFARVTPSLPVCLHFTLCTSSRLSVCLSICLSVSISYCLSVCLPACLRQVDRYRISAYLPVLLSACLRYCLLNSRPSLLKLSLL